MALDFFLRLMLGHMIGDFLLQPYWLVLAKRRGWLGLTIHVAIVTFITAVFCFGAVPLWWMWMIVLFVGHLFIDQFRTFIFTDNTKGKGLLLLFLDQLAHVVLVMLIAWGATGWTLSDLTPLTIGDFQQPQLLVYLTALAIVVSVVPVLEAEITVGVLAALGTQISHTVAIEQSDRLYGATERIVATILIIAGFWPLAILCFVPRLIFLYRKGDHINDRPGFFTKFGTSLGVVIILSLILLQLPAPPPLG